MTKRAARTGGRERHRRDGQGAGSRHGLARRRLAGEIVSERRWFAGHVFISYVREDADRVGQLQRALQVAGIPVWRDTADLWPGEDWQAKIRSAITDNALVFIACFSQASIARDKSYQNEELTLAVEQMRLLSPGRSWLIPVRFDECDIPDREIGGGRSLSLIQRVDLFGDRCDDGTASLVEAIRRILGEHPDPEAVRGGRGAYAPSPGTAALSPPASARLSEPPKWVLLGPSRRHTPEESVRSRSAFGAISWQAAGGIPRSGSGTRPLALRQAGPSAGSPLSSRWRSVRTGPSWRAAARAARSGSSTFAPARRYGPCAFLRASGIFGMSGHWRSVPMAHCWPAREGMESACGTSRPAILRPIATGSQLFQ